MDPMTMALLISGGSNLLGSFMGIGAADQASENNSQIADWNMRQGALQNLLQMTLQQRAQNDARLGTTDAQGNRTYFEPGVGRVTKLSPDQEALQAAGTANQMYDTGPGEMVRRAMRQREADAALRESNYADRLFGDMTRTVTPDSRDVRNQSIAAGATARTQGVRDAMEKQALQMNRRGEMGGNFGDALAKIADSSSKAYQSDRATLGVPATTRDLSPSATNLMGAMRARVSSGAGASVMPQINVPGGDVHGTGVTGQFVTATPPMFSPDYGPANMVTQLGGDISSGIRDYYANQQLQQLLRGQQGGGTGVSSDYFSGGANRDTYGSSGTSRSNWGL